MSVSTVAALPPATALFHEEQYFDWRVYAIIAAVEALTAMGFLHRNAWSRELIAGVAIGTLLLLSLAVVVLRMTTEVTPTEVRVWFGWIPIYRREIPAAGIKRVEPISFRPIADYGFWGVRAGRDGERVLIARGGRGVRIELVDGSTFVIGSQRTEELALAIQSAIRPVG